MEDKHDIPSEFLSLFAGRGLLEFRVMAARAAIRKGGGPSELARKMSRWLGSDVSHARIAKWRYTGIPCRWGVVVEHVVGTPRAELNPVEYAVSPQDIHKLHTALKRAVSTT